MAYNGNISDKITIGRQMEIMISRAISARNRHALTDLKDLFHGAAERIQQEIDKMPVEEKNKGPYIW